MLYSVGIDRELVNLEIGRVTVLSSQYFAVDCPAARAGFHITVSGPLDIGERTATSHAFDHCCSHNRNLEAYILIY